MCKDNLPRKIWRGLQSCKISLARYRDLPSLKKEALFIGWTNGDLRTHELSEPLHALIQAVHDFETQGPGDEYDAAIMTAWTEFHGLRLKILIHCL